MIIKRQYDQWITKEFAPAIANDDYTGMYNSEIALLNEWLAANKADVYGFYDANNQSDYDFTRCDVTGLMSDCIKVTLTIFE